MQISSVGTSSPYPSAAAVAKVNALPTKSGNTDVDAVLTGSTKWWHDGSNVVGTASVNGMSNAKHALTFSFMTVANSLSANDARGFQAMTTNVKQAVRDALAYAATVANVTFTETDTGGDIQFGTNNQQGKSGGYAYTPNSRDNDTASVYMANDAYPQLSSDWSPGSQAWSALVHEVGHALGLKHPGAYNAGGGKTPGPYLPKAEDNIRFSLMSYNNPSDAMVANTTANDNGTVSVSLRNVQARSYERVDIEALQYLYGRSQGESETGAQTYAFTDDDADKGEFFKTITNSNSESEIDASGMSKRNVIDLRAGYASSIGLRDPYARLAAPLNTAAKWKAAVHSSAKPTYTGADNLAIAKGSHIDRAKGGSAADTIVGNNDATNTIDAGGGNDTIYLGKANS
ncbi:MAG: matrixin family metalloprotease, partial [Acidobacteriota bacterium]